MSRLTEFAKLELADAGLFEKGSDYDGLIGPAVLELIEKFAEQGHSGYSAQIVANIFYSLARFKPINTLKHPLNSKEYIDRSVESGYPLLQSTRVPSVFSDDGGVTWYDVDGKVPRIKSLFGVKKAYIKFEDDIVNFD